MIEKAFQQTWWRSNMIAIAAAGWVARPLRTDPTVGCAPNEYTMKEYNFSLFFGLAVQLYEMTLISDDSPVDRYFEGDRRALTAQEMRGLAVFTGDAACAGLPLRRGDHGQLQAHPEGAVVDGVKQPGETGGAHVQRQLRSRGLRPELLQHRASARSKRISASALPTRSATRCALIDMLTTPPGQIPSAGAADLADAQHRQSGRSPSASERRRADPSRRRSLRNVELTAPYFHNGGQGTLLQVVNFYNRGGDFREHNAEIIDFEIGKLNLTKQDLDDLVAFLKGLTDERVLYRRAPFDSPQLFVPNGHRVVHGVAVVDGDGTAADIMLEVPAVGRNGGAPLKGFLKQ